MATNLNIKEYLENIGFAWKESYNYHISNSTKTPEEYLLFKKNDFLTSIPKKAIKIYIDLNVWINFRDVHMGKNHIPKIWSEVYKKAIILNELYDVYFVASTNIFLELQKQKKTDEYKVLLNIIGKLSKELIVENPQQLVFDETLFWLGDLLKTYSPFLNYENYQWDKASTIFGVPLPQPEQNNEESVALKKVLIDAFYRIPLKDFVLFGQPDESETAVQNLSNQLNFDLANKLGVRGTNFEDLLNEEFQGAVDASSEIINQAITQFVRWRFNTNSVEIHDVKEKEIINAIINMFKLKKIKQYFPSLQVFSGLHASVRYDKTKKFSQNDLYDFHHASSALPYCQYFITDNPLAQRLNTKPLEFGKKFGSTVLPAKPDLILNVFEEIIQERLHNCLGNKIGENVMSQRKQ